MSNADETQIAQLLDRARAGDRAALEELFAACRNYLNVVATSQVESWLRTKFDASDLVQQTMLEAHRAFAQFGGRTEAEWLAWLRQILNHNAADVVRRYRGTAKRQIARERPIAPGRKDRSSAIGFEPIDGTSSPSQRALNLERQRHLADALARLSEDHRQVIQLRNLQRMPFDQVAAIMQRSRPAVQMLWMRAIKRLECLLGERKRGDE